MDDKKPTDAEIRAAFALGCDAIVYMAGQMVEAARQLRTLETAGPRFILPVLELTINNWMNALGDALSNADACEEGDEEKTGPAFVAVRGVLGISLADERDEFGTWRERLAESSDQGEFQPIGTDLSAAKNNAAKMTSKREDASHD